MFHSSIFIIDSVLDLVIREYNVEKCAVSMRIQNQVSIVKKMKNQPLEGLATCRDVQFIRVKKITHK